MQIIRERIRIPENHEIVIKVPRHIPENEIAEVTLLIRKSCDSFDDKIDKLREAAKDKLFADDIENTLSDFQSVDLEDWE